MTVIDDSPSRLMEAMEENLHDHVSFVQQHFGGMHVDDTPGLLIVDSGLGSDTFNKVLRARLDESNADAHIERALAYFRDTNRPFTWWVGPCSRPLDLEARLEAHGLRPAEHELGMTIDLGDLPDDMVLLPGAVIRRVSTEQELHDFAGLLADLSEPRDEAVVTFFERAGAVVLDENSPMRFYVAYVDGEPAAVSELFADGVVAGIHMVATATQFRRRGLGMALTWTALEDGQRMGMTMGALQASEAGVPVYERLGFQECGSFVEYAVG